MADLIRAKAEECRLRSAETDGKTAADYLAKALEWEAIGREVAAQDLVGPIQLLPIKPKSFMRFR